MKRWLLAGLSALAVLVIATLPWTEPWTFFSDTTIDEALPSATADPTATASPEVKEISHGSFVSQEHSTAGTARLLGLDTGAHLLRLEDFSTSNGPDLHVWLSTEEAGGNWFKYKDGRHIDLGELKANNGNQNYAIAAGTDLAGIKSVVIWCERFAVAFGSAPINP